MGTSELRFNAAGFGWKSYSAEENAPVTYSGADIRQAQWFRCVSFRVCRLSGREAVLMWYCAEYRETFSFA